MDDKKEQLTVAKNDLRSLVTYLKDSIGAIDSMQRLGQVEEALSFLQYVLKVGEVEVAKIKFPNTKNNVQSDDGVGNNSIHK